MRQLLRARLTVLDNPLYTPDQVPCLTGETTEAWQHKGWTPESTMQND